MTETQRPERGPVAAVRRIAVPWGVVHTVGAVLVGLLISFIIILAIADRPIDAFGAFVFGTFQDLYGIGTMLSLATILMVTGLASAVAFRAGAFNIGGEGQVYVGGLTAALIALYVPGPGPLITILAMAGAAVAGLVWIVIPAILRAYFNVTEIVTTLMSTYIATAITAWLVTAFFKDPTSGARETEPLPRETWLPRLFSQSHANVGLIIAIVLIVTLTIYFRSTRSGLRVKLVGLQPPFAETMGIPQARVIMSSLLASGALAGLAGGLAVLGITHAFMDGFSPQFGFLGITVALIGRLSPIGVGLAALLYATLMTGATSMQSVSNVPFALVFLLQGILILLVTSKSIRRRGAL